MRRIILIYFARKLRVNQKKKRQAYPQLWYAWPKWLFPYRSFRRKILEFLCLIFTGHEISDTEWSYGGGDYVDLHCRWCDRLIKVRKEEEIVPSESIQEGARELGFYD